MYVFFQFSSVPLVFFSLIALSSIFSMTPECHSRGTNGRCCYDVLFCMCEVFDVLRFWHLGFIDNDVFWNGFLNFLGFWLSTIEFWSVCRDRTFCLLTLLMQILSYQVFDYWVSVILFYLVFHEMGFLIYSCSIFLLMTFKFMLI